MAKQKINIYSVNSQNIIWLFEVITSAFWLLKNRDTSIDVEIILLDDPNVSFLRNNVKYYVKLFYVNLNQSFRKLFRRIIKIIFISNIIKSKILNYLEVPFEKNSIHNKINLKKEVFFKYKNINFVIKHVKSSSFLNLIFIKLLSFFISCFIFIYYKLFKSAKVFLKLRYKNILIGDVIASTFLRNNPKNAGSLRLSFGVLSLLNKVIFYNIKSKKIVKSLNEKLSYIILPEPTYLQVFWKRLFIKYGATSIETHSYEKKFYLNDDQLMGNPWIARKKPIKKISTKQREDIGNFFNIRLNNPEKIMSYMTKINSNNNNENQINTIDNKTLNFRTNDLDNNKELVAIIFLHSFDDAQYCFGIDDFTDLYEWTIFSIDSCLANNEFDKILIKPHPGSDYEVFPGDKIAFDKIYQKYNKIDKINFIKKDSSIVYLSSISNVIGITHHGSVAEELVYLNQNAIGYIGGMWSDHYKFLDTWKTKNEYTNIIKSYKKKIIKKPSNEEFVNLFNYIIERKLNAIDLRKYSIRLLLAREIPYFKQWNFNTYDDWETFNNETELICNNDLFTDEILSCLYEHANSIN